MTAEELESHQLPHSARSPFVRLLATSGRVRTLDAFLRKYQTELSAGDIADVTDVSESTFSRNKDVLLELNIIEQTHSEAGKQYYRLNVDSPLVKLLAEFHTKLIQHTDEINSNTVVTEEDYIGQLMTTKVDSGSDDERSRDQTSTQHEQTTGKAGPIERQLNLMLEEDDYRD